ncbi:MAG: bifunctional UDP-N-acetylglucosamine diphosphorylase/glucosamine-1-phosphate N-acetyltransferase GlmU [Gammaproteobacteria bacterium]
MPLSVIILAAGRGTRMKSALPKVLHPLGGRPLLAHVIDTASQLAAHSINIVHGHGGEAVRQAVASEALSWRLQHEQLGTGHAVDQALPTIDDGDTVLVLYGDMALVRVATLRALLADVDRHALSLLSVNLDDPTGYGRIVRDDNDDVARIVEERDADDDIRAIREVNTGFLAARAGALKGWLSRVGNNNAKGEYYLTDCIEIAVADGHKVSAILCADPGEALGVNDKAQLAAAERVYQLRQAEKLMRGGVTLRDPARIDVRGDLSAGRDVEIDVNVIFAGRVELGDNVRIGANCIISDCAIGAATEVLPNCIIEDSEVGARCRVGPFARLRPGNTLADQVHIGNFVEAKKSTLGKGSKANHLSYIGDSEIGERVNVGAGTITCNYDGASKHRTVIGDDVFVGSDTQLVAPVTVGAGATIAAGSTINKDVAAGDLALSRARQTIVKAWDRPRKGKR